MLMNRPNTEADVARRQIPNWLFGAAIAISIVGALWLLGRTTAPPPAALPAGIAGLQLTDFSGPTSDGQTFRLSDTRGKVVLLNFWATWCPPCREEIPDLIKVQEKYKDRGFTIVGVSQDDTLATATRYVKQNGMNYPVLIGDPQTQRELNFQGIPTSVLLDKEGKIVWMQEGINPSVPMETVLSEQIEKLL